jgi:hypothetical protein
MWVPLLWVPKDLTGDQPKIKIFKYFIMEGLGSAIRFMSETVLVCEECHVPASNFMLYFWMPEWRDDFDPFDTNSNRDQVWIKTYTIYLPASATGRHQAMVGKVMITKANAL